ncbi:MAG: reverse transcriptase family protein [Gemmataceae bacterium]
MTPFAALLRALTGGRHRPKALHARARTDEWADQLARLGLPATAFDDLLALRSLHPHFHYRHFTKRKKGGGQRRIDEPDFKLKQVQREVIARHFGSAQAHPAAVAYREKRSVAHHVWPHAGAELLAVADVEDFFPSTHEARVGEWWRERVADGPARLLTLLTTYRGGLPQGAPTSPGLSNFVNRGLDERLARRAASAGAHFTRYCDDLLFSWPHDHGPPADFEGAVRTALHEFGYVLHPKKGWRVYRRRDEPEVTGLILTRHGGVRLPDRLRETMRRLGRSGDPGALERLAGYKGYEAMVRKRPLPREGEG